MECILKKVANPLIKNNIEYSYTFNEKNCSFSFDKIYLESNADVIPVVFYPRPGYQLNDPYYMFCEYVISNIVHKIANKEIRELDEFTIELEYDYRNYKIKEAE